MASTSAATACAGSSRTDARPPKGRAAAVANGFSFPNDFSPAGKTLGRIRTPSAAPHGAPGSAVLVTIYEQRSTPRCTYELDPEWDRIAMTALYRARAHRRHGERSYPFSLNPAPTHSHGHGIDIRMWPAPWSAARPRGTGPFLRAPANPLSSPLCSRTAPSARAGRVRSADNSNRSDNRYPSGGLGWNQRSPLASCGQR